METLQVSKFKRNPALIQSKLSVVNKLTMCKDEMYILFPARYLAKQLAFIGTTVKVLAMVAICDAQDNYSVVSAPIFLDFSPFGIEDVMINNVLYKKLIFKKDTVIIPNNDHLVTDSFMYEVFDEFFISGRIPWYMNYEDVGDLLIKAKEYASSKLGDDPTTIEILTSIIARSERDKRIYYRECINQNGNKDKLAFIGLDNVQYSFNNTGARLIGGYFGYGLINSMVEPETSTSKTSEILRS